MEEVKIYKVVEGSTLVASLQNQIEVHCSEPLMVSDSYDIIVDSDVDVKFCEIHRICKLGLGGKSERLIAFDPSFKERLLPEIMSGEIRHEYERAALEASNLKAIVLSQKKIICDHKKWGCRFNNSFWFRLKSVFVGFSL